MSAQDWINALNRIEATNELPITLQGGEPTVHPDFYTIVNGVNRPMDLLTNCQFDMDRFTREVPITKFKRNAPYASIRISYHPEQMELNDTVKRVSKLAGLGYQVGVWSVLVPEWREHILNEAQYRFRELGIDFRTKELMDGGTAHGHGTYKYKEAVGADYLRDCMCRTTELLVAPDGSIHRCHSDIYNLRKGIGHIMQESYTPDREYRFCGVYGDCSGCDIKLTFNRFQQPNWTSVEIKDVDWEHERKRD